MDAEHVARYQDDGVAAQIERNFVYHPPMDGQTQRYETLRAKGRELAHLVNDQCPKSREQALALTKLEEAIFWANAAIARNE